MEPFQVEPYSASFNGPSLLVTFSRVPYRMAERVGEIDDEILADLTAEISSASEVDLAGAATMIRQRLVPISKE